MSFGNCDKRREQFGGSLCLKRPRTPIPRIPRGSRISSRLSSSSAVNAANLGMWAFLVTEILFFGGMFTAYIVYRSLHYPAFEIGSHLLEVQFGVTNTAVLILSSLTMAMAIHSAQVGKSKGTIITWLILTMILGATFLGLEVPVRVVSRLRRAYRVRATTSDLKAGRSGSNLGGQVQMFMCFYFFMTGLHALHMVIGLGVLVVLVIMTARNKFSSEYYAPLEIDGLYWHFVDIVWIFLFPLLYLIGGALHALGVRGTKGCTHQGRARLCRRGTRSNTGNSTRDTWFPSASTSAFSWRSWC